MSKQLTFEFSGTKYTLEYTRKSVQKMEANGFNIGDFEAKPLTVLPQLFEGAFYAHHPFTKKATIEDIYSHMPGKADLVSKLAEMYAEPIAALMADPEDAAGNVTWTASF